MKLSRIAMVCLLLTMTVVAATAADVIKVERDVAVPMRDGVVLRADVSRPAEGGPFPVLVMRTPYNKEGKKFDTYVDAGYIIVCQDARGRYKSDGRYESFYRAETHDAEDGYDTVEWAAKLAGSNGKVSTFGVSYNAFLQWRLAPLRPPSLVAMAAHSIPPRLTDVEGPGTIRPGRRLQWFYTGMAPDMRRRTGGAPPHGNAEAKKLWDAGEDKRLLNFLPWLKLGDEVFGTETDAVRAWLRAPHTDPWRLDERCGDIAVPNENVTGWFDHCNSTIELSRAMMERGRTKTARKGQRLIIGPWGHVTLGKRKVGDVDFGPKAAFDTTREDIRWFDYWLKGQPNGVDKDAPVKIFVMGANRWRDETEWPPKRAKRTEWFLVSDGHANTPAGDGRLVTKATASDGADHYRYDPREPVPTLWTKAMFTVPADQRPLAQRKDILVYQTEPLREAVEITGYPEVELFASSSAPDTDFFARLIDVTPDGATCDLANGMVRARFRGGLEKPKLLKPGEVTRFTIRMRPTANEFQPGHRIRLDITSSDFPNYDRNHNTAADPNTDVDLAVAEQTVHHGANLASRLVLPVITNR